MANRHLIVKKAGSAFYISNFFVILLPFAPARSFWTAVDVEEQYLYIALELQVQVLLEHQLLEFASRRQPKLRR